MPSAVFVYGHTATGKTLVVSRILEALQYSHAVVNCVECYMPHLLFEPILNKIHGNYNCHSCANCSVTCISSLVHELPIISCLIFIVSFFLYCVSKT